MAPKPTSRTDVNTDGASMTRVLEKIESQTKLIKELQVSHQTQITQSQEHANQLQALKSDFDKQLSEFKIDMKKIHDDSINKLTAELNKMQKENAELRNRLNDMDAMKVSSNIVLSGKSIPAATPNENVSKTAKDALKKHFNLELSEGDITSITRITSKATNDNSQKPKNCNLLLRVRDDTVKKKIISNSKKVKSKNLYANEHLIKSTLDKLIKLREEKDKKRLHSVYTKQGLLYVRKKNNSDELRIRNEEDFQKLMNEISVAAGIEGIRESAA